MDPDLLKDMPRRIKQCSYNSFHIKDCGMKNSDLELIVATLNECPKITYLDLSRNNLKGGAVRYLLKLKYITTLNLEMNDIGDKGALELAKKFKRIILFQSALTEEGIKKIIKCEEAKFLHLYVEDEIREGGAMKWLSEYTRQQLRNKIDFNNFQKKYKKDGSCLIFLSRILSKLQRIDITLEVDKKQIFVNDAIKLCNIYFSHPKDISKIYISILPIEVFLILLYQFGKDTLDRCDKDIENCSRLIFDNFAVRRFLIQNNKHIWPNLLSKNFDLAIKVSVNQWWSHWNRNDDKKRIFRYKSNEMNKNKTGYTIYS